MAAKYDVGDNVNIVGKVIEVVTNETGTTYQVKFKANNKMQEIWFEEGDIPEPNAGEGE